ncbi:MAG: hypothetical protein US83_C0010G0041 [Candidatus Falkowbacteria bacterium GW2011_GWC2_38_22]|uniref:Uncharacterized protein n=1 Tax=Candidatus Falkowbacteria bacterium GW2011_GWE1_38_31 TaxID=1618638 RepID=A0A0G0JRQ7_9BACT|nr:MAG: hypothetical protein US73_C0005G0041 [Candidatus Falkowbacteria bacterium GW2011_GWF2_38_1205]KKQ61007.1 MAG: hypothetical protein US83_C0010G0041 [Candidatus Falkowbacteria bacterium GW2011_GWC2_38_22]KKQ63464.1 MAG: hypothetical protein US84_C0006G0067 [Candidatus Falkowbacteria bacterium GW2011_GWF1_38_22]KKQ65465.1 MAG: hypothetical protein US87_C0007G0041 [Candidatus Falkowbacteria bacterium GW2011_GWE2_38_254]KKQ70228.1 MAG: hypothetical protein US91_C0006G0067 [Candidatus Falkowb
MTGIIKNKKNIVRILFIILLFFVFVLPMAMAVDSSAITGLDEAAKKGYGKIPDGGMASLPSAIGKVIGVGLSLIGILFLGLMIYGGFIWMIARGNEGEVTKAKDLIQAAIIGLVVVLAAYAITQFIGQQLL